MTNDREGSEDTAEDGRSGDRIAKFLSRAGVASRRDAEKMLAEGRVRLNGAAVTHPATFVSAGDIVQVDGGVVGTPEKSRLWRYHKPSGLVTTHHDPEGRPDGVREAAGGAEAGNERGAARPEQRGAAAADQRWRAGAAIGAAGHRLDPALPGAGVRHRGGTPARRVEERDHRRGRAVRADRRGAG